MSVSEGKSLTLIHRHTPMPQFSLCYPAVGLSWVSSLFHHLLGQLFIPGILGEYRLSLLFWGRSSWHLCTRCTARRACTWMCEPVCLVCLQMDVLFPDTCGEDHAWARAPAVPSWELQGCARGTNAARGPCG